MFHIGWQLQGTAASRQSPWSQGASSGQKALTLARIGWGKETVVREFLSEDA